MMTGERREHQASSARKADVKPKTLRKRLKKVDYKLVFMTLPFVVFMIMFSYVMLFGWTYAFVDYMPSKSIFEQDFVGLKHFAKLFQVGSRFPVAFKNTLIFGLLNILVAPVPLIMAVLFSEIPKGKFSRIIQTITSFPNFISWILVFSLTFMFFSVDGRLTQLLVEMGVWEQGYSLLADPGPAYIFQTLLSLWKSTGWTAIIYLSAIAGIDPQLYDAAAIDGANRWQTMWHITTKGVIATFFVMLVLNVSGLMNAGFDQYYVFTNTMNVDRLEVLATFAYKIGVGNAEIAYGTAIGMTQSIISIILLFSVNRLAKKITGNSVF